VEKEGEEGINVEDEGPLWGYLLSSYYASCYA